MSDFVTCPPYNNLSLATFIIIFGMKKVASGKSFVHMSHYYVHVYHILSMLDVKFLLYSQTIIYNAWNVLYT